MVFSLCVTVFTWPSSYTNISHIGLGAHPTPLQPCVSNYTLFPNKVIFWRTGTFLFFFPSTFLFLWGWGGEDTLPITVHIPLFSTLVFSESKMLRQEKILVGKSQIKNDRSRIQSPGRQSRHGVKHRKNCISWEERLACIIENLTL